MKELFIVLLLVLLIVNVEHSIAFTCFGKQPTDLQVCGGNGICKGQDSCECLDLSSGNYFHSSLNGTIQNGVYIYNPQRDEFVVLQTDGNMVTYQLNGAADYSSGTYIGFGSNYMKLDNVNGAFTFHTSTSVFATILSSCPGGVGPFRFIITTEKNLIIYDSYGKVCWRKDIFPVGLVGPVMYNGYNCDQPICYRKNATVACNHNGQCVSYDKCVCNDGWYGNECESLVYCFGKLKNDSLACSGNGYCSSPDNCTCSSGFYGTNCSINSNPIRISLPSNSFQVEKGANLTLQLDAFDMNNQSLTTSEFQSFNVYWLCIDCPRTSGQPIFDLNYFKDLMKTRTTYTFSVQAYKTYSLYPARVSNILYFTVTIQEPVTSKYGFPSYFIKGKEHNLNSLILGVQDINNSSNLLTCSTKCNFTISYNLKLSDTNSTRVENSGTTTAEFDGNSTIKFNPVIAFTGLFYTTEDSLTFKLLITGSYLKSSLTLEEKVPVYDVPSPNGKTFSLIGANSTNNVYSLKTLLKFSVYPWTATNSNMYPFRYSLGFQYQDKKNVRITQFYDSVTGIDSIYLPYFSSDNITMVVFVQDSQGFEYNQALSGSIKILPYPDSRISLLESLKSDSRLAMVSPYDTTLTFSDSSLAIEMVKSLEIPLQNPAATIDTLKQIALSNSEAGKEVALKFELFCANLTNSYKFQYNQYGFVKEKVVSSTDISNILTTSTSLFNSGIYNVSAIYGHISKMAIIGEPPIVLLDENKNSISKRIYSSNSIDIFASNFIKRDSTLDGNFDLQGVKLDVDNVLDTYNGYSKQFGMSLIKYSKNVKPDDYSSSNPLSSFAEFSIYKEGSLLEVKDLTKPFILTLPITTVVNTSLNYSISCKYWNETTKSWESNGCQLVTESYSNVQCQCNHTTLFSAFVEYNTTRSTPAQAKELESVYITQLVYGSIFFIVSCILLVLLIVFRNHQPVKSRFVTPFVGISALIIQSALLLIVQKSVLLSGQVEVNSSLSSTVSWEYGDLAVNILSNIITIIVNSITITAFISYLYQVSRFELLKYFYYKLARLSKSNGKEGERLLLTAKHFLSTKFMFLIIGLSFILNILYWTLWTILVRTQVITGTEYTYIVSISFTCIILSICLLIIGLIILDYSISFIQKKDEIISNITNMDKKNKKNLIKLPVNQVTNWYSRVDSPLYFRVEMLLFVLCFIFLACNQIIGLSGISSQKKMVVNDSISMAFEILYLTTYCLVFGGYSLLVLLISKLRKNKIANEEFSELATFMESQEGFSLMEWFCKKEFSLENVLLYSFMKQNENVFQNGGIKELKTFFSTLFDSYIKDGCVNEVNIPSQQRKSIMSILNQFDSKEIELSNKENNIPLRSTIIECMESLKNELLMNLQDSYSRLVLTSEYSAYNKIIISKNELLKQSNLNH